MPALCRWHLEANEMDTDRAVPESECVLCLRDKEYLAKEESHDDPLGWRSIFGALVEMQNETIAMIDNRAKIETRDEAMTVVEQARRAAAFLTLYSDTLELLTWTTRPHDR